MRQILFFAFAAMMIAGVMPRVMSSVGIEPAVESECKATSRRSQSHSSPPPTAP